MKNKVILIIIGPLLAAKKEGGHQISSGFLDFWISSGFSSGYLVRIDERGQRCCNCSDDITVYSNSVRIQLWCAMNY